MNKYQRITQARKLLELPERASMEDIRNSYRGLIRLWHPDTSKESKEKCTEMTARIIASYDMIINYCSHYKFSFSQEEVRFHFSEEEWWQERFGDDPVWGGG